MRIDHVDGSASTPVKLRMASLTVELPEQRTQTEFNIRRWAELLANRELARFEGRIETDRHGHIIMSPPPAASHGGYQFEIAFQLRTLMPTGRVITECPISTADGVKATDAAWASAETLKNLAEQSVFMRAPEICVEVISPSNTKAEIDEKTALYFDAGAKEVWLCAESGVMTFLEIGNPMRASRLCPNFPARVRLQ
jgi:Uma2 family endonuclease